MVAPTRRYHVALVDPLPAGLEALNPALAVTGSLPQDDGRDPQPGPYRYWWWGPWYEHQNLRDERAEAFTSLLWDGVYTTPTSPAPPPPAPSSSRRPRPRRCTRPRRSAAAPSTG